MKNSCEERKKHCTNSGEDTCCFISNYVENVKDFLGDQCISNHFLECDEMQKNRDEVDSISILQTKLKNYKIRLPSIYTIYANIHAIVVL